MAINELDLRRKRLEEYQIKARFALAESYDRATTAQVDAEIKRQKKIRAEAQVKKDVDAGEEQPGSEKLLPKEYDNSPTIFKE
jgi:hypothetical protein